MIEVLSRSLGFVSASLVALIALGFGLMFVFFSGSAAMILGHFLRFVRPARVALPAIGLAACAGRSPPRSARRAARGPPRSLAAWGFVARAPTPRAHLARGRSRVCGGLFVLGCSRRREDRGHAAVSIARRCSCSARSASGRW
jgi:hypothetical protein